MSRAQRHRESAQAARRLSAVATRGAAPGAAGGGWTPSAPGAGDDGFDWFGTAGTTGAAVAPRRPADDVTPGPGGAPPAGPPPWERWRGSVADRVPLPLRGAARVPVAAAVAVVLVALAVVGGAALRSASAGAEVVPLGRPLALSSGPSVSSGPAGPSAVASVDPSAGARSAPPGGPTSAPSAGGPAAGPVVVVDVVGKVRRPGLVRLPPGSRVADAVAAAGGATDDAALTRINLARPLGDGEQVLVPDRDDVLPPAAAAPPPGGTAASPGSPAGPLDLNAATAADLDGLPGVGPVIAGRIVAWRTEHGRFAAVDELAEVAGIGPTLLERLRPLVRV